MVQSVWSRVPAWIAISVGLSLLPAGIAAANVPVQRVAFVTDAKKFVKNTGPTRLRKVSRDVILELQRLLHGAFPFVSWNAGTAENADLRVRLTDRARVGTILVYERRNGVDSGGNAHYDPIDIYQMPVVLYRPRARRPIYDPEQLTSDVVQRLQQHFAVQPFRELLLGQYVSSISIADRVEAVDDRIVVPFAFATLQAAPQSQLRVKFVARPSQANQSKDGWLYVTPIEDRLTAPSAGMTQGIVADGHYPGVVIQRGTVPPALAGLLRPPLNESTSVSVQLYGKGTRLSVQPKTGLAIRP